MRFTKIEGDAKLVIGCAQRKVKNGQAFLSFAFFNR
jgi:hypothetical protein